MEEWKLIVVAPNYAISNLGQVKRLTRGKRTRPGLIHKTWSQRGYQYVTLQVNGKHKTFQIHRLAAAAFLGESRKQVNHKNGKRGDNRVENLEYLTAAENQRHSRDVLGTFQQGSRHWNAKLTENDVKEILERGRHETTRTIAKSFPVSATMIGYIVRRKWWKHVEPD